MDKSWFMFLALFLVGFFLKGLHDKIENMQFKFDLMVKEIERLKSKFPDDEKTK